MPASENKDLAGTSRFAMFPLRDDNPIKIVPFVTWALIAVNVMIFLYEVSLGPGSLQVFVYQYGAIPAVVVREQNLPARIAAIPPIISLFTSMFLHGGWMHLIGNMWYLWIFGNNIEEAMGHLRYVVFYLVCGLVASGSHVLSNIISTIPSIGASGAISGVLGAYLLLYPRARVLTFFYLGFFIRLMYIPAGLILGFWFILQVLSGSIAGRQAAGGVAFWAHIGGFIAGVFLVGFFKKRTVHFFNPPRRHPRSIY
jgi:membrane associated rhomboid family serine protease